MISCTLAKAGKIVFAVMNGRLFHKIKKRIEAVGCVEVFVIFSVGKLNLTVMPGRIRPDALVPVHGLQFRQSDLKFCRFVCSARH